MTSDEFRTMALEIPTAVEQSHMNHPDFRVTGKIFASLGAPDENWGMVKLTPEQQRAFIEKAPEVFKPCSGAWGRAGCHECLSCLRESEPCTCCSSMLRQRTSFHARTNGRDREDVLTRTRGACATQRFRKMRSRKLAETGRVRFRQFETAE